MTNIEATMPQRFATQHRAAIQMQRDKLKEASLNLISAVKTTLASVPSTSFATLTDICEEVCVTEEDRSHVVARVKSLISTAVPTIDQLGLKRSAS